MCNARFVGGRALWPLQVWWVQNWQSAGTAERLKVVLATPLDVLRALTIPRVEDKEWDPLLAAMCTTCVPLFVLCIFQDLVPLDHPVGFGIMGLQFPVWAVCAFQSTFIGIVQFHITEKKAPPSWKRVFLLVSFITSINWISLFATELLGCLNALGIIMGISPSILGAIGLPGHGAYA
ncbi:hypothetical protein CYMTET_13426 [Cymbomonas tetramitiformis]|uniref:Uncharacterized protein n=1 Tax=Cymbomonas tetramitiformis TaxID=36881 RepID=A0AAE0GIF1_9CHLO|nr:hypothetical protein CYMTET_13426 [Cymbomonas tetramitiformis]